MPDALIYCLLTSLTLMTAVWLLSIPLRRVSIIDAFWGPGFAVVASACWFFNEAAAWTKWQIVLWSMVTIWATRLGWHLSIRCFGDPEEDRRYAAMRKKRDPGFWWKSLGIVFWLQAIILWCVALPLQFALTVQPTLVNPIFAGVAIVLWCIGVFFEAVGDYQLDRFRADANNKGQVLNTGLWSLTRHPNYFGDFMVWWGLWLMSAVLGAPLWTIASPLLMSAFLMKFSGAGLLEKDISERRPSYAEYLKTTNAFFPWPRSRATDQ